MIKIQCRKCSRVVDYSEEDFNDDLTCQVCGGYFEEIESEDDEDYYKEDLKEESEKDKIIEHVAPIVDLPKLNEEISIEKFNPEAKTRFD